MKPIDPIYQTMYSELAQRSIDGAFSADFSAKDGAFVAMNVKERKYWYFRTPDGKRAYVGPDADPEISRRVADFQSLKSDYRGRRKLVSTLIREAYLPRPERLAGDIVGALADAGFFRMRGVLVGTVAFQCYSAILGARLAEAVMQTADADFAQFHSISAAIADTMPPMLDVLRRVDPTFRDIPHQQDGHQATAFVSDSQYRVEFLTPNTGSADYEGKPAEMPALGGTAAEPLRFLDYLIYEPVRGVMLHDAGIPLLVPAPERFAIHKLIVATRRLHDDMGTAKSEKDRRQAFALVEAMIMLNMHGALGDAYMEAWERGPSWRDAMLASLDKLAPKQKSFVQQGLRDGVAKAGGKPADHGL